MMILKEVHKDAAKVYPTEPIGISPERFDYIVYNNPSNYLFYGDTCLEELEALHAAAVGNSNMKFVGMQNYITALTERSTVIGIILTVAVSICIIIGRVIMAACIGLYYSCHILNFNSDFCPDCSLCIVKTKNIICKDFAGTVPCNLGTSHRIHDYSVIYDAI